MPLFDDQTTIVVTPQAIKDFTGVKPEDLGFDGDVELDNFLTTLINAIASHIYIRVKRQFTKNDEEYEAIKDILIRTVAKAVAVAVQQRSSPIVRTDDFNVGIIDTAEVIRDLKEELKPFMPKPKIEIFLSGGDSSGTGY